ncbi:MAG: universal stress protein [Pseudomonadota bacterium]|jgi:nucleotide-binding universal stress UspA family protein
MNKVYACIDGFGNTSAVIDWAAWSALRLDVPLEFLHVLERDSDRAAVSDYSGAIGLGAQESLLQELSELDEKRSKLAMESGRRLLAAARKRAEIAGVARHDARLRHGELVDSVLEVEADARLFVLGEHRRGEAHGRIHLDHHVERVIRSAKRPVLVVTSDSFVAPTRFVIAFDGSPTARKTVETVARSPMLVGFPALLAMAGSDTAEARRQLEDARLVLAAAGFHVETELAAGDPEDVLPALVAGQAPALLVMGAYGHSRIRQLIVGSTTTTLLRTSVAPVLILR